MIKITKPTIHVRLEGTLSIDDSDDLKSSFLKALEEGDHVVLDLEELNAIDTCCIQLIFAACWHAQTLGKKMELKSNWSKAAQNLFQIVGYQEHIAPFIQKF